MPITACSGATAMPWPKAIVMVLSSPQRFGTIGAALSGNSVRQPVELADLFQNARCASTPCPSATRAAPTFEEKVNTSDSEIERPSGWVSWIAELAIAQSAARVVLRIERRLAGIQPSPASASWKVEPISNTPVVRRLIRSGSCAFGLFGSKSGDTNATISPVLTLERGRRPPWPCTCPWLSTIRRAARARPADQPTVPPASQPVGGKARAVQISQTVIVQPFLHPGDALVVDVHETDQVRDFGAGRVTACSRAGSRCREYRGDECPAAASA